MRKLVILFEMVLHKYKLFLLIFALYFTMLGCKVDPAVDGVGYVSASTVVNGAKNNPEQYITNEDRSIVIGNYVAGFITDMDENDFSFNLKDDHTEDMIHCGFSSSSLGIEGKAVELTTFFSKYKNGDYIHATMELRKSDDEIKGIVLSVDY